MSIQQISANGLMSREPALTSSAGVMFCTLIINTVVSYGIPVTDALKIFLVSVVGILGPVLSGVITRLYVFSPATVAELQKGYSQVVDATSHADPVESVIRDDPPKPGIDPPTQKI